MEQIAAERSIFKDKYFLVSLGIFIIWYIFAAFRIINLKSFGALDSFASPLSGMNLIINLLFYTLVFGPTYIIGIYFSYYLVSHKGFGWMFSGSFFIYGLLFFINSLFQQELYFLLFEYSGLDGIQFLWINAPISIIMLIINCVFLVIYYFRKKNMM